jgi:predicted ATPase
MPSASMTVSTCLSQNDEANRSAPSHLATMDWSRFALRAEQIVRRLSVFAGCSLTIAEAVCAGDGVEREQVLELLSSLVNKSLVIAKTLQRGEARYFLLETIRQYAPR